MNLHVRKYKKELPTDGHAKSFAVDHGLDTNALVVELFDPVTGETRGLPGMVQETPNSLTLQFLEPPAFGERILVVVTA